MNLIHINNFAKELHTDPRLLVSNMSIEEFKSWIKDERDEILLNLIDVLEKYDLDNYSKLVRDYLVNRYNSVSLQKKD